MPRTLATLTLSLITVAGCSPGGILTDSGQESTGLAETASVTDGVDLDSETADGCGSVPFSNRSCWLHESGYTVCMAEYAGQTVRVLPRSTWITALDGIGYSDRGEPDCAVGQSWLSVLCYAPASQPDEIVCVAEACDLFVPAPDPCSPNDLDGVWIDGVEAWPDDPANYSMQVKWPG